MSQQGHIHNTFRGKRRSVAHPQEFHRLRQQLRELSVEESAIPEFSGKVESRLDVLLEEVKSLAANANDTERVNMLSKLRDVSYSIELPDDTIKRMLYSVCPIPILSTKSPSNHGCSISRTQLSVWATTSTSSTYSSKPRSH